jgi:hypothetical protein
MNKAVAEAIDRYAEALGVRLIDLLENLLTDPIFTLIRTLNPSQDDRRRSGNMLARTWHWVRERLSISAMLRPLPRAHVSCAHGRKRRNFPLNLAAFLLALAVFQRQGRRLDAVRDIEDDRQRRFLVRNHRPRDLWPRKDGLILLIPDVQPPAEAAFARRQQEVGIAVKLATRPPSERRQL